jgi:hypothetical protein
LASENNASKEIYPRVSERADNACMRAAPKPVISEHRFARLCRWAWLFASGAAAVILSLIGQYNPRRKLDRLARVVALLVFVGAMTRVTASRRPRVHRHGVLKRRGILRAFVGQGVRKALRGQDAYARLGAIFSSLLHIEHLVARMVVRLRLGLTRRRPRKAVRNADAPPRTLAPAAFAFNSS